MSKDCSNEVLPSIIHIPVDDMPKLQEIAPVKWTGCRFSLFGITIKPNRTVEPGTWVAVYPDGELLVGKIKEDS
jgi:hypothetical protein